MDDHPTFRRGLADLIAEHADLTVCGQADSATNVLGAMRTLKPDIVTVDISLPGANGTELIKQMAAEQFLQIQNCGRQTSPGRSPDSATKSDSCQINSGRWRSNCRSPTGN